MRPFRLIWNSFRYYKRTNLPVMAAVAVAVAVMAGALLVGDSVTSSLRRLALARIGNTRHVLSSAQFFSEQTAVRLGGTPMIVLEGVVTRPEGGGRAHGVAVYGVDEAFWKFHGISSPPQMEYGGAWLSPGLAAEVRGQAGQTLLVRVEQPSAIPKESLHGSKDDTGKTISVVMSGVLDRARLGEFALRPSQAETRAVFVSLALLQRQLKQTGAANTMLFADGAQPDLKRLSLEDLGVRVVAWPDSGVAVESASAILTDSLAGDAVQLGAGKAARIFTYMVNSIRAGSREVPYSVVSAVDRGFEDVRPGEIVLTDWAARDLQAKAGDQVTLDYYYWLESGALDTRSATFRLTRVIPTVDRRKLAPEYPGISDSMTLSEWDPPFPVDLKKVRPVDEDFWKKFNTTPKAYVSIEDGQKLWGSRFGRATAVWIPGTTVQSVRDSLRAKVDPAANGVAVIDLRDSVTGASRGTTDFGEYFLYFSFFLVVSALLLLVVFFQLNVDQRLRQIGVMRALGLDSRAVFRTMLGEGLLLTLGGTAMGVLLAGAYSAFLVYGLNHWWRDAVGTSSLELHLRPKMLAEGARAGFLTAIVTLMLSLLFLRRVSPLSLLAGTRGPRALMKPSGRLGALAVLFGVAAAGLLGAGAAKAIPAAGAFFGAGFLLLAALVLFLWNWWRGAASTVRDVWSLGMRNATWKPGRSALCVALVASAMFLLISLEAFRQGDSGPAGGVRMVAESQLPIVYDLNSAKGREALNLSGLDGVRFYPFRVRPGDDASCLNLYEPRNPRILGASEQFVRSKALPGPWELLGAVQSDGTIAAIADANSIQYVLHKKVGDVIVLPDGNRLKLVGALTGSLLQSELIVSDRDFVKAFPKAQGFRFFLIEGPDSAGAKLEDALSDFGFDVTSAQARLAAYHRVENTYLTTFQVLGALGLLLGVIGMGAVLLRNVLERRQQLGVMRAVGFNVSDLTRLVLSENAYLVACGLGVGTVCALIAVAPAWLERGGRSPGMAMFLLLIGVPLVAFAASLLAVRYLHRANLLESLREDAF